MRDDLAVWRRLNVAALLTSGITAAAGPEAIGEEHLDADDVPYPPLLVQPILAFDATRAQLQQLQRARGA